MIIRLTGLMLFLLFILFPGVVVPQEAGNNAKIQAADSLFDEGQYEKAIAGYMDYIDSRGRIKEDEKKEVSETYGQIAICYYQLDNYDQAIAWFGKELEIQKELGDPLTIANTLNNIGLNYKIRGNYDKAIEYYEEAVRIDEGRGDSSSAAKTYNNIGMVYRSWGRYDKAIEYFEKSLHLRKELDDQPGVSKTLNNIGLVYTEWKKYQEALLSFRESLAIEESVGNDSEIAIRHGNLGRVYFKMDQYDTALSYFEKALSFHLKNNDQDQIALAYNNIGKVYYGQGKNKDALSFLSSAYEIFNELGMEMEKATVLANLSDVNRAMGNYGTALQFLESSTVIAEKLGLMNQLQQNFLYYSDIYSDQKNFEKSLEYFKKSTALKDTVFNRETQRELSDFQIKYEKEKDQARILALEKENLQKTNQRNAYMFTGLAIIVIASFIILYFRQRANHIRIISDQKIRQLEEEKKLMAAKLLVEGQEEERKRIATELHDGLGVLLSATKLQFSVISEKSPENKELIEKATRMLEQATGDVRKISHNMMPGLLTKLGFFEAVEDLFEQIDDAGDIHATCSITGNQDRLAGNKEIMLYRIVQEMVNNSLKHAQAGNIELRITISPEMMELKYADDGIGFNAIEKLESDSLGLKSIQSRVNFLNGKIELDTKPGEGVKYKILIPV